MSLSETQELLSVLQEIMAILDQADLKVNKISKAVTGNEPGVTGSSARGYTTDYSLRREMRIMNMYMIAMQRFTGSDTVSQMVNKIQSITMAVLRLQMLLNNIQRVRAIMAGAQVVGSAGMNPFAWLELGANAIGFGMSLSTLGQ
jgi:hypothetical protein